MKINELVKLPFRVLKSINKYGFYVTLDKIKRHTNSNGDEVLKRILAINVQELDMQRRASFKINPVISILVPVFNTDLLMLNDMIISVLNQTYPYWELCIADASDNNHHKVGKKIKEFSDKDSRIKYIKLDDNLGISENTNKCIDISNGEYLGMLDHDDILAPNALYEVVKVINCDNADFIYSDEVKFSDNICNSFGPNFKPNFSKDELRAHNYICHFNVYKKSLLNIVGKYSAEYDGSQDHDMVLRLTEVAKKIVHIPKILYYWRVHNGSVSQGIENKIYAIEAAYRAVSAQLIRTGENGSVSSVEPYHTLYRVEYDLKDNIEYLLVIYSDANFANFNCCVNCLEENSFGIKHKIVILSDKREPYMSQFEVYNNILSIKRNYKGKYLIFVNSSCRVISKGWDKEFISFLQRNDVSSVGAKIVSEGKIVSAGIVLNPADRLLYSHFYAGFSEEIHGYEACLMHVRNTTAVSSYLFGVKNDYFKIINNNLVDSIFYTSIECVKKGLLNVWTPFVKAEFINCAVGDKTLIVRDYWYNCAENGDEYINRNLILYENVVKNNS